MQNLADSLGSQLFAISGGTDAAGSATQWI